jgi:hypothetical protein
MPTTETTTETTAAEQLRAEIAALQVDLAAKKAELRALRAGGAKAKAEPKPCACGCEELTRGGDFLPGHDQRFRGAMLRAIDAGDEAAIAALLRFPKLLHGLTESDLRERLGAEARRKAEVAARAERRKADAAARKAQRDADREANARLREESRTQTAAAAQERLTNKERARAAASGRIAA